MKSFLKIAKFNAMKFFSSKVPLVLNINMNRTHLHEYMRIKIATEVHKELRDHNRVEIMKDSGDTIELVCSSLQTKEWRKKNISKSVGQKDSSCEKYQRMIVSKITRQKCLQVKGSRLNQRTLEFRHKYNNCMSKSGTIIPDGFDWTEDFDGFQIMNGMSVYYNFKFVCGKGGSQTRTLREVYHFIETQLRYLVKSSSGVEKDTQILFINILDGDQSHYKREHFTHLLLSPEYASVSNKCFVGDSNQFHRYFKKYIEKK